MIENLNDMIKKFSVRETNKRGGRFHMIENLNDMIKKFSVRETNQMEEGFT